eukprot:TRINITY_DN4374_c0_g1_i2.p1 TRINITY_DN4374_c0_g1~~TRINITY_DN4374_c0_g1_i2.p1  ORF type:complete len:198 (-),score=9.84 TRINITY_DN4374_c0_g1_i2:13-606(-)
MGPREVTIRSTSRYDRALINCYFQNAPFSTGDRGSNRRKQDRREVELSLVIKRTFESAILTTFSPNSEINIRVEILQSDGGASCAAINAVTLALIDAGIPLKDFVIACSVGCVDGIPLLDLNHVEESSGSPDIPVAILPKTNEIIMLQLGSRLPLDTLEAVLSLALEGCKNCYQQLSQVVVQSTIERLTKRGIFNAH